ncbi:Cytidine deaminase [Alteripontixanthobacter maritimus]|uniref:Cytidine deaminase n=2 Tax=Alteripontixanthobacter maritimus TaxID=2161824 RepID=A0A369QEV3_9SPHN|nr:Cytidine deaminase [Alteripontixanthobacter maritimus]
MSSTLGVEPASLLSAARASAATAYAPYSGFRVGAALLFSDGEIVTAANVENASYGLSLCAETLAVGAALASGRRGGLVAVAVAGADECQTVQPCGRCRQVLHELASLDSSDPAVITDSPDGPQRLLLSHLLPHAFGPDSLVIRAD